MARVQSNYAFEFFKKRMKGMFDKLIFFFHCVHSYDDREDGSEETYGAVKRHMIRENGRWQSHNYMTTTRSHKKKLFHQYLFHIH